MATSPHKEERKKEEHMTLLVIIYRNGKQTKAIRH